MGGYAAVLADQRGGLGLKPGKGLGLKPEKGVGLKPGNGTETLKCGTETHRIGT